MDESAGSRMSIDSVLSILSNFNDEAPKDRNVTHRLIRDARTEVNTHAVGLLVKGKIRANDLLYALLDNAPTEEGQRYVATTILVKVQADPATRKGYLVALAEAWLVHLLFPVKAAGHKRKNPPSDHQTPPLHDTATLIERATRGDQSAFRSLLHQRQGYKCAVTKTFSIDAPVQVTAGHLVTALAAGHILPFSLNDFKETGSTFTKAVITWDMLRSWSSFDIEKLAGRKINGAANGVLLRSDLDSTFEDFIWWFEATELPSSYRIASSRFIGYEGTVVTFVNESEEPIDLPDPAILAIHAAFARVFHASGAAEYIDSIWRDMGNTRVLSSDGSTDVSSLIHFQVGIQNIPVSA